MFKKTRHYSSLNLMTLNLKKNAQLPGSIRSQVGTVSKYFRYSFITIIFDRASNASNLHQAFLPIHINPSHFPCTSHVKTHSALKSNYLKNKKKPNGNIALIEGMRPDCIPFSTSGAIYNRRRRRLQPQKQVAQVQQQQQKKNIT